MSNVCFFCTDVTFEMRGEGDITCWFYFLRGCDLISQSVWSMLFLSRVSRSSFWNRRALSAELFVHTRRSCEYGDDDDVLFALDAI